MKNKGARFLISMVLTAAILQTGGFGMIDGIDLSGTGIGFVSPAGVAIGGEVASLQAGEVVATAAPVDVAAIVARFEAVARARKAAAPGLGSQKLTIGSLISEAAAQKTAQAPERLATLKKILTSITTPRPRETAILPTDAPATVEIIIRPPEQPPPATATVEPIPVIQPTSTPSPIPTPSPSPSPSPSPTKKKSTRKSTAAPRLSVPPSVTWTPAPTATARPTLTYPPTWTPAPTATVTATATVEPEQTQIPPVDIKETVAPRPGRTHIPPGQLKKTLTPEG